MRPLDQLWRENILALRPYRSARDDYSGEDAVFLDANENPFGSATPERLNRYPDPHQRALKTKIGRAKGITEDCIFLGNGSDEAIDLLIRATCEPQEDAIVVAPPTYGMYRVLADIQGCEVIEVPLSGQFQPDVGRVLEAARPRTKLLFLCSPNNPTGNLFESGRVEALIKSFSGLVVLDEAYTDFAPGSSFLPRLNDFPNLVILQTFSKAWGLAALRLGMAFAQPGVIDVLTKIKYPYNINAATQTLALKALERLGDKERMVEAILAEREKLRAALGTLSCVENVYPSDANFLLVRMQDARATLNHLMENLVIVRDRSRVTLCEGCLRITVGTAAENQTLVHALSTIE